MYIMCDVEADGPCPGLYSMVRLGAVVVEPALNRVFDGFFKPLDGAQWMPEALAVPKLTREETLTFPDPKQTMLELESWLQDLKHNRLIFISDNNGFDFQFVNYYCWRYLGYSPFGHSSQNLGSVYKGLVKDMWKSFKFLRDTKHDHNPVNDAKGNAEAFLKLKGQGLKF